MKRKPDHLPTIHFWVASCFSFREGTIRWNVLALFSKDIPNKLKVLELVGGFNPFEKYESNWIISPGRDEKKCIWNHHLVNGLLQLGTLVKITQKNRWWVLPLQFPQKTFWGKALKRPWGPVNSSLVSKCPMCPIFFEIRGVGPGRFRFKTSLV